MTQTIYCVTQDNKTTLHLLAFQAVGMNRKIINGCTIVFIYFCTSRCMHVCEEKSKENCVCVRERKRLVIKEVKM